MRAFVTAVICASVAVAPAAARIKPPPLLRTAARTTGLKVLRRVRVVPEPPRRYDADTTRSLDRAYPRTLQQLDDVFYSDLGLLAPAASSRTILVANASALHASYDAVARVVRARRKRASRTELLDAYVRALVDQHYNLRRLVPLRARDRDAALAANATVDAYAASVSRLRPRGSNAATPIQRFLAAERLGAFDAARRLVASLNEIGGRYAVRTALRSFPRTTTQLLHVDQFLARTPPVTVQLPSHAGDLTLITSETFGELDLRALLSAFSVAADDTAAEGWTGGRLALYRGGADQSATALVVRFETPEDADEWRMALLRYIAAAFPNAKPHACPAVDDCWLDGSRELAVAARGTTTAFASGTEAEVVAALAEPASTSSRG